MGSTLIELPDADVTKYFSVNLRTGTITKPTGSTILTLRKSQHLNSVFVMEKKSTL